MSLKTMIELVFGKTSKNSHIRKKAEEFIYLLRDKNYITVKDAKGFIGAKKTYYKITRKLRFIGLLNLTKDIDGNFIFSLSLDAYKFFIKRQLIEEVEKTLKANTRPPK